jgi:hypothetical protein
MQAQFDRQALEQAMQDRGLTATALHRELIRRGCEVSEASVRKWISGAVADPGGSYVAAIAAVLGREMEYFFHQGSTLGG